MKKDICSFENRVAVVTGAAGNIGLAVCRQLVGYGVRIAACDVDARVVEERIALRDRGFQLGGERLPLLLELLDLTHHRVHVLRAAAHAFRKSGFHIF